MKKIHFLGHKKFLPGIAEIQKQLNFSLDDGGYEIACSQDGTGITVDITGHKAVVTYGKDCLFFRAFSLVLLLVLLLYVLQL